MLERVSAARTQQQALDLGESCCFEFNKFWIIGAGVAALL